MGRETSAALKELFARVEKWPEEAQAEVVQVLEEIEHELKDVEAELPVQLTPEDIEAIEEGLEDERQGRLVSMSELRELFDKRRK